MPAAVASTSTPSSQPAPDLEQPRKLVRLRPRLVLHFPAIVFIVTTLLLPIGAINGQNNLLFWMFGLAIAALVTSGIAGTWIIASLSIERDPVPPVHAGETVRITYRLHNASRFLPAFAINIEELPMLPAAIGAGRVKPTWPGMLTPPIAFAEFVPKHGSATIEAEVAARSWGLATLDTLEVWTSFPFGLSRKTVMHAKTQEVLIRPPIITDLRHEFVDRLTRPRSSNIGGSASMRSGPGEEFHSLREFSEGDSPRSVAWKRSAMSDRLLVRQNARDQNRRVYVGIADLRGMDAAEGRRAVVAAASAVAAAYKHGFAVGLLASDHHPSIAAGTSTRTLGEIYDRLALLDLSIDQTPRSQIGADARTMVFLIDPRRRSASIPGAEVFAPEDVLLHAGTLVFDAPEAPSVTIGTRVVRFLADLLPASRPTVPGGTA